MRTGDNSIAGSQQFSDRKHKPIGGLRHLSPIQDNAAEWDTGVRKWLQQLHSRTGEWSIEFALVAAKQMGRSVHRFGTEQQ